MPKWLRADLTHEETQQFTKDVLNHMRERLSDYQEAVRRPLQPGGHPRRVHHLPLCQARQGAVSRHHHRQRERNALLHQLLPPARRLHRGYLLPRWTCRTSSRPSTPPAPCSTPSWARSCPTGRLRRTLVRKIAENYKLPVLHHVADLLRVHGPRLSDRRAVYLPRAAARSHGGVQPHHRLLPPGAELERRQDPGVCRPRGVRPGPFAPGEGRRAGGRRRSRRGGSGSARRALLPRRAKGRP